MTTEPTIGLTDIQKEALIQHQQWLMSPMTKTMIHILKKHAEVLTKQVCNRALSKEYTDAEVRSAAIQLAGLNIISERIIVTEYFVANSN